MSELHYFAEGITEFFDFSDNSCQILEENLIKSFALHKLIAADMTRF